MVPRVKRLDPSHGPLGGKESPWFDESLSNFWEEIKAELRGTRFDRNTQHTAHNLSVVMEAWRAVKRAGPGAILTRGDFEFRLISDLRESYSAWRYAQEMARGSTPSARTPEAAHRDYLMYVRIVAAYTGRRRSDVLACGDDKARLISLRR